MSPEPTSVYSDRWTCDQCRCFTNTLSDEKCTVCGSVRPDSFSAPPGAASTLAKDARVRGKSITSGSSAQAGAAAGSSASGYPRHAKKSADLDKVASRILSLAQKCRGAPYSKPVIQHTAKKLQALAAVVTLAFTKQQQTAHEIKIQTEGKMNLRDIAISIRSKLDSMEQVINRALDMNTFKYSDRAIHSELERAFEGILALMATLQDTDIQEEILKFKEQWSPNSIKKDTSSVSELNENPNAMPAGAAETLKRLVSKIEIVAKKCDNVSNSERFLRPTAENLRALVPLVELMLKGQKLLDLYKAISQFQTNLFVIGQLIDEAINTNGLTSDDKATYSSRLKRLLDTNRGLIQDAIHKRRSAAEQMQGLVSEIRDLAQKCVDASGSIPLLQPTGASLRALVPLVELMFEDQAPDDADIPIYAIQANLASMEQLINQAIQTNRFTSNLGTYSRLESLLDTTRAIVQDATRKRRPDAPTFTVGSVSTAYATAAEDPPAPEFASLLPDTEVDDNMFVNEAHKITFSVRGTSGILEREINTDELHKAIIQQWHREILSLQQVATHNMGGKPLELRVVAMETLGSRNFSVTKATRGFVSRQTRTYFCLLPSDYSTDVKLIGNRVVAAPKDGAPLAYETRTCKTTADRAKRDSFAADDAHPFAGASNNKGSHPTSILPNRLLGGFIPKGNSYFELPLKVRDDFSSIYFTNKICVSPKNFNALKDFFKERKIAPVASDGHSYLVELKGKPFVVESNSSADDSQVLMRKMQRENLQVDPGDAIVLTPCRPYPPKRFAKIVFSLRPLQPTQETRQLDTDVVGLELHRILREHVWAVGQLMVRNFGFPVELRAVWVGILPADSHKRRGVMHGQIVDTTDIRFAEASSHLKLRGSHIEDASDAERLQEDDNVAKMGSLLRLGDVVHLVGRDGTWKVKGFGMLKGKTNNVVFQQMKHGNETTMPYADVVDEVFRMGVRDPSGPPSAPSHHNLPVATPVNDDVSALTTDSGMVPVATVAPAPSPTQPTEATTTSATRADITEGDLDRVGKDVGIPFFGRNGVALTQEEREAISKKKGVCMHCGIKTHQKSVFRKGPITNDRVYKGICILHYPDRIPAAVREEFERRNPPPKPRVLTAADVGFSFGANGRNGYEFTDIYRQWTQLDKGNFGEIFVCEEHRNGTVQKVVKVTRPNALDTLGGPINSYDQLEAMCQEIKVLALLNTQPTHCRHILKLHEYFYNADTKELRIVTELLGKNLRDWVDQQSRFTETQAKEVARVALKAIDFMHDHHVVYRSIKEKEFCFKQNGAIGTLTLVDFGLAKVLQQGKTESAFCGNLGYIAPEIYMKEPYRFEVDLFSFGVMMFRLLSGTKPWPAGPVNETARRTVDLEFKMPPEHWESVSHEAQDFVRGLLEYREGRLNVKKALTHMWFTEDVPLVLDDSDADKSATATPTVIRTKAKVILPGQDGFHPSVNGRNGHLLDDIYKVSTTKLGESKFRSIYFCTPLGESSTANAVKCTKPTVWDSSPNGPMVSYDDVEKRYEEIKSLVLLRGEAKANHVLELIEFFYDPRTRDLKMVTELLGPNLRVWLDRRGGRLDNEIEARTAVTVMLEAIDFVHRHNIVHRNIHPTHFAFGGIEEIHGLHRLRLIGFGSSIVLEKNATDSSYCGTVGYIAPEIYKREEYSLEVDLFSFGVLLYRILSGGLPWDVISKADYRGKTLKLEYNFDEGIWNDVSAQAKDFIRSLLAFKENRLNVAQALSHPWLVAGGADPSPKQVQTLPEPQKPPALVASEEPPPPPSNRRFQRPDPPDTLTKGDRGVSVELNKKGKGDQVEQIGAQPSVSDAGNGSAGAHRSGITTPQATVSGADANASTNVTNPAQAPGEAAALGLTPEMVVAWKELCAHLVSQLDPTRKISQYTPIPDEYINNSQAKTYHRSLEDSLYTTVTVMRMQSQGLGLADPSLLSEMFRLPEKVAGSFGGLFLPLIGEMLATIVDRRNDVACINKATCFLGTLPGVDGVRLDQFVTKLSAEMVHLQMKRQNCRATNEKMLQMEAGAVKVTLSTRQHSIAGNLKAMVLGWWEAAKTRARQFQLLEEAETDPDVVMAMAHAGMVAQSLIEHSESIQVMRNDQTPEQIAAYLLDMMGIKRDDASGSSPPTMPTAQGTGEKAFATASAVTPTTSANATTTKSEAATTETEQPQEAEKPSVDLNQLMEVVEGIKETVEDHKEKLETLQQEKLPAHVDRHNQVRQTVNQTQVVAVGVGVASVPSGEGAAAQPLVNMADAQRCKLFGSENVTQYNQADADRARISELEMENARNQEKMAAMEEQLEAVFELLNHAKLKGTNNKKIDAATKLNEIALARQLEAARGLLFQQTAAAAAGATPTAALLAHGVPPKAFAIRTDKSSNVQLDNFGIRSSSAGNAGEFVVSGPIRQPTERFGFDVDEGEFRNENDVSNNEDDADSVKAPSEVSC